VPGLRVILIIAAIAAVILLARRLLESTPGKKVQETKELDADKVVACAQCGVHVPEAELVQKGDMRVCRQCAQQ
jgi:hypothetical protein